MTVAGFDPIREGVPIVEAGGKCNMSRIKAVLDTLGIPVYLIFDCDGRNERERRNNEKENVSLHRLCETGVFEVFPLDPVVAKQLACFPHNLEATIEDDLGELNFLDRRNAVAQQRKVGAKSPVVYETVFGQAYDAGYRSQTLDQIVAAIRTLHERCRNPVVDLRDIDDGIGSS